MTTRTQLATDLVEATERPRFAEGTQFNLILRLAEARIRRTVRTREQEKTLELEVTDRATELPDDFLRLRSLTADTGTDATIEYYPPESFRQNERFSTRGGAFGTNTIYSIEGNTLLLAPTPSEGSTITLVYVAGLESLVGGAATNELLRDAYDVYFWGVMWAAYKLDEDDQQASQYEGYFATAMKDVNRSENRARFPRGALRTIGSPHQII